MRRTVLRILLVTAALLPGPGPSVRAQSPETSGWFPAEPIMARFLADPLEPRTGVMTAMSPTLIDARIGLSGDVRQWQTSEPILGFGRAAFGMGAAAFLLLDPHIIGFARPDGAELNAGDYYVGLYVVGEQNYGAVLAHYRVLLSHISAHAGDGLYDITTGTWHEGRLPVDYSRDSIQLMAEIRLPGGWRAYVEGIYTSFHGSVDRGRSPASLHAGASYRWPGKARLKPFLAVDLRTHDVGEEADGPLGFSAVAGVRLGQWEIRGLELRLAFYKGPNWRGQFVGQPLEEWSIGAMVDF